MNNFTKLSKISYVVDILQQAREKLLEATTIINTDKRDEVMETITSAIDEVYDLLEMEGQVK
jgi:HD superfamily phosphohydrolase YqeK